MSSFFVLVHQDAGMGAGDVWMSAGLSVGSWKVPAVKGQPQNLRYFAAKSMHQRCQCIGKQKATSCSI